MAHILIQYWKKLKGIIRVITSSNEVEGGELNYLPNLFVGVSFKFLANPNPNPNLFTRNIERKVVQ